jgi:hypothetical protein
MMQSKATSVAAYLKEVPQERRDVVVTVRETILANLPPGYEEGMQYGMIGYFVPHRIYPDGYHCDPTQPLTYAALAAQKNYVSLYLMCIYSNREQEAWSRDEWLKTGKKLNMGKSCVRFRSLDDIPLQLIGKAIRSVPVDKFVAFYEEAVKGPASKRARRAAGKKS